MGKQITITLKQLKKLLAQPYHNKFVMLESAVKPLEDSFAKNVFTSHGDTKKIANKRELAVLIARGGKSHKPGSAKAGAPYNAEYLERKAQMGESRPHVYENHGFLDGTDIYFYGSGIRMSTQSIMQRGFDYLEFHERNRSVLKLTFLRAWQNIINNMINAFSKEAQSL